MSKHLDNMLRLSRAQATHKLQHMGCMRRDIAPINVHANLVGTIYELDLQTPQQLTTVVTHPAAAVGDQSLLHRVELQRQDVAFLVAQLGIAEERILELASHGDRLLDYSGHVGPELGLADFTGSK